MMRKLIFFVLLLCVACARDVQSTPVVLPAITPTQPPAPAKTSTEPPPETVTAFETVAPTTGSGLNAGRLDSDEARGLVEAWYQQQVGLLTSIEETTPEDVWQQLGVRIFRVEDSVNVYQHSYMVHGQEVWRLHTGFYGKGVRPEDLVSADLDGDSVNELVYVYADDVDVGNTMHVGVFWFEENTARPLEADWVNYPGEMDLRKDVDGQVLVFGSPRTGGESQFLGYLVLQGEVLSVVEDPGQVGELGIYTSRRFGISFQYPSAWEELGEDHYQGEDGFFQISPSESVASGLSDLYHRVSFRMVRACTWEANAIPGQYGQDPELRLLSDIPGRAQCQILPGSDALQTSPTLLIETPGGGLALLRADQRQMELVQRTLAYDLPGGEAQPGEDYTYSAAEITPELGLQFVEMGELTVEEYSLFPASEHTPMEEQLAAALAGIRARRDAWRAGPLPDYEPESLEQDNAALAPFGVRLEGFTLENGEQHMRLYRGEALIKDDLSLYPRSLIVEPTGQSDFALIVEEPGVGLWLIRRDRLESWNIWEHLDSYDVAFSGGKLAAYEFEPTDWAGTLWVTLEGERVYSLALPWQPLSVQINGWHDDWLLEMDGTLVVNGEIMNLAWGYGEIFEYRLLNGKPFFFYEKGGQMGIFYDGQELPVHYDEIIHAECCGGMNNPRFSEHMAWFYARREGVWYYVEIGVFK